MDALLSDITLWLAGHESALRTIAWGILAVGLTQNLVYASQIPIAWSELREHSHSQDTQTPWDTLTSKACLPVSVIVPAYNEGRTILQSVQSLLTLRYPKYQLIVVNDGSTDDTLKALIDELELKPVTRSRDTQALKHAPIRTIYASSIYPNLLVIDKENGGGKADATNAGLSCVRTPLFCVIDADSILEPEALLVAVRPFMESSANVIAVGGTINIANGCSIENGQITEFALPKNFLARVQVVEYTRAFLMARLAGSRVGTLTLISGAFGIFRSDIAIAAGGYDSTTLGEDMELVLKLHRYMKDKGKPYEIRYVPEPVCWTEAPESLRMLSKQRIRWQRGAIECISRHKALLFNPKYGRLGMLTMPLLILVDLIGPAVELLGYLMIPLLALVGILSMKFMVAYLSLMFLFGVFLSTMSVLLEQAELERFATPRDLARLALTAALEHFGYRQLCTFWRIQGAYLHLVGNKPVWEPMDRVGFRAAE